MCIGWKLLLEYSWLFSIQLHSHAIERIKHNSKISQTQWTRQLFIKVPLISGSIPIILLLRNVLHETYIIINQHYYSKRKIPWFSFRLNLFHAVSLAVLVFQYRHLISSAYLKDSQHRNGKWIKVGGRCPKLKVEGSTKQGFINHSYLQLFGGNLSIYRPMNSWLDQP